LQRKVANSLILLAEGEDTNFWGVIVYDAGKDEEPQIYLLPACESDVLYEEAEKLYEQLQKGEKDNV